MTTWSCTTDHVTSPCGDCSGCRYDGIRPGDDVVPPGDYRCGQPVVVVVATVAYVGAAVLAGVKLGLAVAEAILERRARR